MERRRGGKALKEGGFEAGGKKSFYLNLSPGPFSAPVFWHGVSQLQKSRQTFTEVPVHARTHRAIQVKVEYAHSMGYRHDREVRSGTLPRAIKALFATFSSSSLSRFNAVLRLRGRKQREEWVL